MPVPQGAQDCGWSGASWRMRIGQLASPLIIICARGRQGRAAGFVATGPGCVPAATAGRGSGCGPRNGGITDSVASRGVPLRPDPELAGDIALEVLRRDALFFARLVLTSPCMHPGEVPEEGGWLTTSSAVTGGTRSAGSVAEPSDRRSAKAIPLDADARHDTSAMGAARMAAVGLHGHRQWPGLAKVNNPSRQSGDYRPSGAAVQQLWHSGLDTGLRQTGAGPTGGLR